MKIHVIYLASVISIIKIYFGWKICDYRGKKFDKRNCEKKFLRIKFSNENIFENFKFGLKKQSRIIRKTIITFSKFSSSGKNIKKNL